MSGWTVVALSVVGGLALDLLWPTNPLARLGAALYDRTLGRRWRSHSEKPRSER